MWISHVVWRPAVLLNWILFVAEFPRGAVVRDSGWKRSSSGHGHVLLGERLCPCLLLIRLRASRPGQSELRNGELHSGRSFCPKPFFLSSSLMGQCSGLRFTFWPLRTGTLVQQSSVLRMRPIPALLPVEQSQAICLTLRRFSLQWRSWGLEGCYCKVRAGGRETSVTWWSHSMFCSNQTKTQT